MSCEAMDEKLNDYADGSLEAAERGRVERHLEGCAACRSELRQLEGLRDEVARLPAGIEPERDLWPEIAARIGPPRVVRPEFPEHRSRAAWRALREHWAPLAAAATLLVVLSSALTAWWVGGGAPPAAPAGAAVAPAAAELEPAAADYALAIERLLTALYEHGDELAPETVAVIDANLRVIDSAIRRAREALETDPQNPELARMLSNNYRMKLQLLQRANRLIERTL